MQIASELLLLTLFRLIGADAGISTNGGCFGQTTETCRQLAATARLRAREAAPVLPMPAGGITLQRVPALPDFFGLDTTIPIGNNLISRWRNETVAFATTVAAHNYR